MAKYRKKPVVIEAIQLTENNLDQIKLFMRTEFRINHDIDGLSMEIKTFEGIMRAEANDFIIKGIQGEFYPCKPDIFEKTYELVNE